MPWSTIKLDEAFIELYLGSRRVNRSREEDPDHHAGRELRK
jgi:hypothetical protein